MLPFRLRVFFDFDFFPSPFFPTLRWRLQSSFDPAVRQLPCSRILGLFRSVHLQSSGTADILCDATVVTTTDHERTIFIATG
jgi:hypothetical protein